MTTDEIRAQIEAIHDTLGALRSIDEATVKAHQRATGRRVGGKCRTRRLAKKRVSEALKWWDRQLVLTACRNAREVRVRGVWLSSLSIGERSRLWKEENERRREAFEAAVLELETKIRLE